MVLQSLKPYVYHLVGPWYFEPWEQSLPMEDRSLIYGLHDDVVYYMARGMPIADQAAFALSCKAAWNILNGHRIFKELNNSDDDRMSFLERFERIMPHYCLCYRCKKFHPRTSSGCDHSGIVPSVTYDYIRFRTLNYHRAKEIMNYHRFGSRHGSPFKEIVYPGSHGVHPYACRYAKGDIDILCSVTCKKVQGNLVFKQDVWVTCLLQHRCAFVVWRECSQIGSHFDGIPQNIRDITGETFWSYRCPLTRSEKRVHVSFPSDRPGYVIFRGTTWQNLGTCQNSPTGFWTVGTQQYRPPCSPEHHSIDLKMLVYPCNFDDGMPSRPDITNLPGYFEW